MDPIDDLIDGGVYHVLKEDKKNPHITKETIVNRLIRKILHRTRVRYYENEKTMLFHTCHEHLLKTFDTVQSNMSHDEKACVERVLSKDSPHTSELLKFACCWYKYEPSDACKLFAVDGLLGNHPKFYIQEAFSLRFQKHNHAVRELYAFFPNPETIKEIVEKAFCLMEDEPCAPDLNPEFESCVGLYSEMVGEDEMKLVAAERRARMQQLQAPKRKKVTFAAASAAAVVPVSPTD